MIYIFFYINQLKSSTVPPFFVLVFLAGQPNFNETHTFIFSFLNVPLTPLEVRVFACNLPAEALLCASILSLHRARILGRAGSASERRPHADNYFECQKDVVLISSLLACWLGN